LHAGNFGEADRRRQECGLLWRCRRMLQAEDNRMADPDIPPLNSIR
jgi:hypothetical protein